MFEIIGNEANGGLQCVPVECGTFRNGLLTISGRELLWIQSASKALVVDMLAEIPSPRSWRDSTHYQCALASVRSGADLQGS